MLGSQAVMAHPKPHRGTRRSCETVSSALKGRLPRRDDLRRAPVVATVVHENVQACEDSNTSVQASFSFSRN